MANTNDNPPGAGEPNTAPVQRTEPGRRPDGALESDAELVDNAIEALQRVLRQMDRPAELEAAMAEVTDVITRMQILHNELDVKREKSEHQSVAQSAAALADINRWPIIWRVTAPACGSHDHDMVMTETEDLKEALESWREYRADQWPVRMERVQCGALPGNFKRDLARIRNRNAQNSRSTMRDVPAAWSDA